MADARWWKRGLVAAAGLVLLAGCGDGNLFEGASDPSGTEAQKEAGVAALNDGDWDAAIEIFGSMNPEDPEVQKYLASAYMGKAGFDTLELVDLIAEAQDFQTDGSVLYESAVDIFDTDGDGTVSSEEVVAQKDNVEKALEAIQPGLVTDREAQEDLVFQAGTYAAVHAVVLIADVLDLDDVSADAVREKDRATLEQEVEPDFPEVAAELVTDLAKVKEAVDTTMSQADGGNDVTQDLDEFLRELGYDPDAGDREVTSDELVDFLDNI